LSSHSVSLVNRLSACEFLELVLTQINIMGSEGLECNRCVLWTALMIIDVCVLSCGHYEL